MNNFNYAISIYILFQIFYKIHSLSKHICTIFILWKTYHSHQTFPTYQSWHQLFILWKTYHCAELFTQWMGFNKSHNWKVLIINNFNMLSKFIFSFKYFTTNRTFERFLSWTILICFLNLYFLFRIFVLYLLCLGEQENIQFHLVTLVNLWMVQVRNVTITHTWAPGEIG